MPSLGPFKPFLFDSYIGNNKNPPKTDEICWSLDFWYCGAQLYLKHQFFIFFLSFKTKHKTRIFSLIMNKKSRKYFLLMSEGGANYRVKMVMSFFNFESARALSTENTVLYSYNINNSGLQVRVLYNEA